MATYPLKSIFGKLLGLTRPTTVYTTERLFAKGGFIGPYLFLGTTEGSESALNIQGATDVQTSSTGTAALNNYGVTYISSGASTLYTLAAPAGTGVRKSLVAGTSSTAVRQVTSAVHIVRGVSGSLSAGDSGIIVASTSHTLLTFNGLGQSIELVGHSTAAWLCTSVSGYSSLATPVTTV